MCVCVCVCVCARAHVCVCVCVCVTPTVFKPGSQIDLSAFSAPFFGIFDVSQRTCSQNQCVLFLSPCSRSLYCRLAKYSFSSDASICSIVVGTQFSAKVCILG